MSNEDRIKALFNATPETLAAIDAALRAPKETSQPASLRLFKMGQAAKETDLSRSTVWRLCREGKLKTVEVRRGSHRIPESELRRFVEGRTA